MIGTKTGKVDGHGIEMIRRGDHPSPDREVSPRKEDRDINGPEAGRRKGDTVAERGRKGVQEGETIIEDIGGTDDQRHPFVSSIGAAVAGMRGPGPEVVPTT